MDLLDNNKIAFMKDACYFYYKVMLFCLKNMGENYQIMMNNAFKYKI